MSAIVPNSSSIQLSSGDYLDLLNPDPSVITTDVLAHHLAQANRFAGAPVRPYSVCEHTILVSKYLEAHRAPPWTILKGLHHDDSEAFLHDITRPLKDQLPPYRIIEDIMTTVIEDALAFARPSDEERLAIKEADLWALACEAYYLMPSQGRGWHCEGMYDPGNKLHVKLSMFIRDDVKAIDYLSRLWILRHTKWLAFTEDQTRRLRT